MNFIEGIYLLDYNDDSKIFNGSIGWKVYACETLLDDLIGGTIGYFAAPAIVGLLTFAGTIGGGLAFVGSVGMAIMMSKHMSGMTNKSPFTWTTTEEGIDAMRLFGGDANKHH